jgi:soluble lytic murein transglycosylase
LGLAPVNDERFTAMRRTPYSRFRGIRAVFLAAAFGLAALVVACQDDGAPAVAPTEEPPPATPVVVTPTPPDPAVAHELQRSGQYDEAIAVYQDVITRSPEPERPPAQLALARTYIESGRHEEARQELEAFLAQAASPEEHRVATFLLAEALEALGEDEQALELYGRYADDAGPAAPYAQLARARLLASLGRVDEAAQAADLALGAGLPPIVNAGALLDVARGFEGAGALDDAIVWYERLFRSTESTADRALARWRIGVLRGLAGDADWADQLMAVVRDYPSTAAAQEALADLQEAEVAVDGYTAGLVYYRHFDNDEAQQALQTYLDQDPPGPHDAEAAYYLAAVYERQGDDEEALEAYDDSLRRDPESALADDAAWWRARLLEDTGRDQSALRAYREFPRLYPGSSRAQDASFRYGLLLYKDAQYEEAILAFVGARSLAEDDEADARARFWLAKAHRAAGDSGEALAILEDLAGEETLDYYSLRAAVLLGHALPSAGRGALDVTQLPPVDWPGLDAWAHSWLSPQAATTPAFLGDPRWARANALLDLQLPNEASLELESLLNAYGTTSSGLYALVRAFEPLGLTHVSARAGTRLLATVPEATVRAAPSDLLRLAYPVDYAPVVQDTARRTGVSPLLLLAVIRQESFFDPRAGSSAGALGLTQVISSTAEQIAADLDLQDEFSDEDLYRPTVSILFGGHYLSQQLEAFDGQLAEALAAYNAGPGSASRWAGAAGSDDDLFLEEVSFDQTRAYVKLVTENLAAYDALYGTPSTPAHALPIPRD